MSSANYKPWLDERGKLVKGWKQIKADFMAADMSQNYTGKKAKSGQAVDIAPRRRWFRS